jgi:hypothetical protein
MEYICHKSWFNLELVDQPNIKFCDSCNREVHFCQTNEELEHALLNNLCIAFSNVGSSDLTKPQRRMTLGIPRGYKGFNSLFGDNDEAK